MSEEDEKIMKWNKEQQKLRKKKRANHLNRPYVVLSAPGDYEGKFFGIIYKSCGHEFIITSNELEYRMATGCKTCNK